MENKEYYIKQYRDQKKELEEKGELWRLCQETEDIFIKNLDEIFDRFNSHSYLNDFHRESATKASLGILLQRKLSKEEMIAQSKRLNQEAQKSFTKEAPKIKKYVINMSVPLTISDLSHIYRWIFRKQISVDDLPNEVRKEFKKSKQYKSLIDRKVI